MERAILMTGKKDEKRITTTVKSNQVDNEGNVHLSDGRIIDLSECNLVPPGGGKYIDVVMMFTLENMIHPISNCPSCNSTIPWNRPILLMDNMEFVYPCEKCRWVWENPSCNMIKFRTEYR